jgi:hypothetical protein
MKIVWACGSEYSILPRDPVYSSKRLPTSPDIRPAYSELGDNRNSEESRTWRRYIVPSTQLVPDYKESLQKTAITSDAALLN